MADTVGTESRHNIITHNNLENASHCTNIVWKMLCAAVAAQEADTSIADSDGGGKLHVKLHNNISALGCHEHKSRHPPDRGKHINYATYSIDMRYND